MCKKLMCYDDKIYLHLLSYYKKLLDREEELLLKLWLNECSIACITSVSCFHKFLFSSTGNFNNFSARLFLINDLVKLTIVCSRLGRSFYFLILILIPLLSLTLFISSSGSSLFKSSSKDGYKLLEWLISGYEISHHFPKPSSTW